METIDILRKELWFNSDILKNFLPSGKYGTYRPYRLTERDLTDEEWLLAREHGPDGNIKWTIGGSSCPVALGMSGHTSMLELYNKKMGIKPQIQPNNDALSDIFFNGHLYESVLCVKLKRWLKRQKNPDGSPLYEDVQIHLDKHMYGCGELNPDLSFKYPYMVMNIDALVLLKIQGQWKIYLGEIKTLSACDFDTQRNWRNGYVPKEYDTQVRYYLKGLNLDGAFIYCEWGRDINDCSCIFIDRDKEIETEIMAGCDQFIRHLNSATPPSVLDAENATIVTKYLGKLYGPTDPSFPEFEIPIQYKPAILKLQKVDEMLVQNKKKQNQLEDLRQNVLLELYPLFKKASKGFFVIDENQTVYIKSNATRKRKEFDLELFKKENPALYQECLTFSKEVLLKKDKKIASKYETLGDYTGNREFSAVYYDKKLNLSRTRVKSTSVFKETKGLKKV